MSQDEKIQVTGKPSLIYAILPTALQSWIPLLASVQRIIGEYSLRSRKRDRGLLVPRDSGGEDLQVKRDNMEPAVSDQTEVVDMGKEHALQGRLPYDVTFQKSSPTQIGTHLLNAAMVESQQPDPQSQAFSRQLYINSMAYLLQGLPSDLTEQEVLNLQSALPKSLDRSPRTDTAPQNTPNPSVLHRGVANSVILSCLLLRVALPYAKYFLGVVYDFERSHHVTENALALSMSSVNYFGKLGMDVVGTAVNNKPVMEVVIYCVDGICGGLNEGLVEGIKAIDARNDP